MRMVTCTGYRTRMLFGIVIASLAACSRSDRRTTGDTTATSATLPADSASPAAGSAATAAPAAPAPADGGIAVAQKPGVGPYLSGGNGRSVYLFVKDKGDSSSCYGKCATSWPPVVVTGQPSAADTAVQSALLGTTKRSDGTTQVTYKGAPLYYYRDDKQPGDIKGQNKTEYGAKWYLVSPAGGKQEGTKSGSRMRS